MKSSDFSFCYTNKHYEIEALRSDWEKLCDSDVFSAGLSSAKAMPRITDKWWKILSENYTDISRHYHNFSHITSCFVELDNFQADVYRLTPMAMCIMKFSIWFHDLIYNTNSSTNEEDSALLAAECMSEFHIKTIAIDEVTQFIRATKSHSSEFKNETCDLFLDIDLSILGERPPVFNEYESGIAEEYRWVPTDLFVQKRIEILEKFLTSPLIYKTKYFQDHCEAQARRNILDSIAALSKGR